MLKGFDGLAHHVEGAGHDDGVAGAGHRDGLANCLGHFGHVANVGQVAAGGLGQGLGRHGATDLGGRDDGPAAGGQQGAQHAFERLVVQDADHQQDAAVFEVVLKIAAQVAGGGQVVGTVQNDVGLLAYGFEPARPEGGHEALADVVLLDSNPLAHEGFGRGQGQGRIGNLVLAQERGGQTGPIVIQAVVAECAAPLAAAAEVRTLTMAGGLQLGGFPLHDPDGVRLFDPGDHRGLFLDDPGLFAGDGGDRVAQVVAVLQGNIRDDAGHGRKHVGGVQPSAHAGFDHGPVHRAVAEGVEGHGRGEFEEGGLAIAAVNRFNGLVGGQDLAVGDRAAVDADALVEMDQVRGGVESHGEAGFLEDGRQHGGHRPLAVGAGHVHTFEALLGVTQTGQDVLHHVQAQLDAETMQAVHGFQAFFVFTHAH